MGHYVKQRPKDRDHVMGVAHVHVAMLLTLGTVRAGRYAISLEVVGLLGL